MPPKPHGTFGPVPLVDLQVNGAFGVDFSSPDLRWDDLRECCHEIVRRGTAAFLPTLVSSSQETYSRNLPLIARLCEDEALAASVPGIHLEGPFIAPDDRVLGAHRARHVRRADVQALDALLELGRGRVRLITVAAEIPGAESLVRHAAARGVRVAIGHSFYDAAALAATYQAGARALTHLGNALPHTLAKQGNPFVTGLLADDYVAMFIGDGLHLSRDVLCLLMRCRGAGGLIAVSDASPVAGLPPGGYEALGQTVELRTNGGVFNEAEGHLVGSSRSLLEIVNVLLELDVCSPDDCVQMASVNPIAFLGLEPADLRAEASSVRFDEGERRFG